MVKGRAEGKSKFEDVGEFVYVDNNKGTCSGVDILRESVGYLVENDWSPIMEAI
jgi:hypothetical protein